MNKPNCADDPVILHDVYMTEKDLRAYARSLCYDCPPPVFRYCTAGMSGDSEWRIRGGITIREYRKTLRPDLTDGVG